MGYRILVVDDNYINVRLVANFLTRAGYEVVPAASGPEALAKGREIHPELVILDVMMPDMDGYEVCRRMRQDPITAQVPILMLTALDSVDERVKGFEAGADGYLSKPFEPDELLAHVKVLLKNYSALSLAEKKSQGKVIAVYALRGGVGVSTIAANLAVGLAQLWGPSTALVDLAFPLGQAALMLNLSGRNSWADVAKIQPSELDPDVIRQAMAQHGSGVALLAAPRRPEPGDFLSVELAAAVFDQLVTQFDYVVVDLPHDVSPITLMALAKANDILLVMSPEMSAVRAAIVVLDSLASQPTVVGKISPILNWVFEKRGLPRKDIEAALKQPLDTVVPYAAEIFVQAVNVGAPPVFSAPTSAIGALFEDLAFKMSLEAHLKHAPAHPSEALRRVAARMKTIRSS
jgi:pilus assembly protein CpaE